MSSVGVGSISSARNIQVQVSNKSKEIMWWNNLVGLTNEQQRKFIKNILYNSQPK